MTPTTPTVVNETQCYQVALCRWRLERKRFHQERPSVCLILHSRPDYMVVFYGRIRDLNAAVLSMNYEWIHNRFPLYTIQPPSSQWFLCGIPVPSTPYNIFRRTSQLADGNEDHQSTWLPKLASSSGILRPLSTLYLLKLGWKENSPHFAAHSTLYWLIISHQLQ